MAITRSLLELKESIESETTSSSISDREIIVWANDMIEDINEDAHYPAIKEYSKTDFVTLTQDLSDTKVVLPDDVQQVFNVLGIYSDNSRVPFRLSGVADNVFDYNIYRVNQANLYNYFYKIYDGDLFFDRQGGLELNKLLVYYYKQQELFDVETEDISTLSFPSTLKPFNQMFIHYASSRYFRGWDSNEADKQIQLYAIKKNKWLEAVDRTLKQDTQNYQVIQRPFI